MTVKDRIMEFCRMSGIKPGRFERECGLSNAYLSKLKHEPSRDKLGKIFARYPELNKDWLLNGEGPMLNVVHYPAMEGGNELLVNDQAYYVGRPAGSDEVLIPRDAWEVIKNAPIPFFLHLKPDETVPEALPLLHNSGSGGFRDSGFL